MTCGNDVCSAGSFPLYQDRAQGEDTGTKRGCEREADYATEIMTEGPPP